MITTALTTSQRPGVGYVDVQVHEVTYDQPNPSLRNDAPLLVAIPVIGGPIVGSACIIAGGEAPSFSQRPDHTLAVTYIPYGIRCDVRSLPHWVLAAALLGPALFVTYRWVAARRRHPSGACVKCGYDLRATPMKCPECGLSVAKQT